MTTKTTKKSSKKPVEPNQQSALVRIKTETKKRVDEVLVRANKGKPGRKLRPDDVLSFALGLLTDEHLATIRERSLTNIDRFEVLFEQEAKSKKGLSRDDFVGLLLKGEVRLGS